MASDGTLAGFETLDDLFKVGGVTSRARGKGSCLLLVVHLLTVGGQEPYLPPRALYLPAAAHPTRTVHHHRHHHTPPPPSRRNTPQEYIPADKLVQVKRVLYGFNRGQPVEDLPLDDALRQQAAAKGFDLRGSAFRAAPEQLRPPRVVRIGLVQNQIVLPTTEPYPDQAKVGG